MMCDGVAVVGFVAPAAVEHQDVGRFTTFGPTAALTAAFDAITTDVPNFDRYLHYHCL